jgi:hypothetical protein
MAVQRSQVEQSLSKTVAPKEVTPLPVHRRTPDFHTAAAAHTKLERCGDDDGCTASFESLRVTSLVK